MGFDFFILFDGLYLVFCLGLWDLVSDRSFLLLHATNFIGILGLKCLLNFYSSIIHFHWDFWSHKNKKTACIYTELPFHYPYSFHSDKECQYTFFSISSASKSYASIHRLIYGKSTCTIPLS